MYPTSYELKAFYNSNHGRVIRHVLQNRVKDVWPSLKGKRILAYGYATPYLRPYLDESERCFALMPSSRGAVPWPPERNNLVGITNSDQLPIETESIDNIIIFHALEYGSLDDNTLAEMWRTLKSTGRIIVAAPNRMSVWARSSWTPFGLGTPYSLNQLYQHMENNMFVHERTVRSLYLPPIRFIWGKKTAMLFEKYGPILLPPLGGVNIVEMSKQIYSGVLKGKSQHTNLKKRLLLPQQAALEHKSISGE